MNLALIASAPLVIKIHLATVLPAFVLGSWLFFRSPKGARDHRRVGWVYLALMFITAIDTLFIHSIHPGHFSAIHLFVPLTLIAIVAAVWRARNHDIKGHRRAMLSLYVGGLILAGLFALMPGRLIYRVFAGDHGAL